MSADDLARLTADVSSASTEDLPALLGHLERLRAQAWLRLTAAPASQETRQDENLSAADAARRLGVSKDYVYRHAEAFPFAVRIGRRIVFSARGLEKWNARRQGRV